jgi:hypothetical protein
MRSLFQRLVEWACWQAWNYARKRALRLEPWLPMEAEQARNDQSPDQVRISANEARQVLESRHFINAWDAVNLGIEQVALHCEPDGTDKAQRIIISKQLLHALKREFERKLSDGYMAEVILNEIERSKKLPQFRR